MEAVTSPHGARTSGCQWVKAFPRKLCDKTMKIARKTKKLGQDDPRRMVHSLKVGLAVSFVSLFYYFDPLYDSFGQEGAVWAVLTVVLVFEFSVGATLGKGLNRMLATLVAGALGVGAHCLSTLSGKKGKPILVATFVFIIAVITTFMRFFPTVKANFARWEPGHGLFRYRHPWKMYLKVGNLTWDCAYKVEALNSHLNCKIQTPAEIRGKIEEPCKRVSLECSRALREMASTFLNMVRTSSANTHIESSKKAAEDLKSLLKTNLWEEADLLQIIPAASVTSPLLEIIECVEKIAEAVNDLGKAASFRQSNVTVLPEQPHSIHQESIQQGSNTALPVPHCVITVAE
ncbi:Aluminum-activated malate transporter 8 [Hibiscus syriacus]|uniref:Aluminum-activated malate transporter 8 n=1 Tax=Hibiscus syriacus TaxID=106335 RepID=A0A6A3ATJ8_HIBSY|nr:Aluminum-activated malate transporter 8 [Hibiscus syriacus]